MTPVGNRCSSLAATAFCRDLIRLPTRRRELFCPPSQQRGAHPVWPSGASCRRMATPGEPSQVRFVGGGTDHAGRSRRENLAKAQQPDYHSFSECQQKCFRCRCVRHHFFVTYVNFCSNVWSSNAFHASRQSILSPQYRVPAHVPVRAQWSARMKQGHLSQYFKGPFFRSSRRWICKQRRSAAPSEMRRPTIFR
jgi:hypothetical protein